MIHWRAASGAPRTRKLSPLRAASQSGRGATRCLTVFPRASSRSRGTASHCQTMPRMSLARCPAGLKTRAWGLWSITVVGRERKPASAIPGPKERGEEQSSGPHHCAVLRKGLCLWLLVVSWLLGFGGGKAEAQTRGRSSASRVYVHTKAAHTQIRPRRSVTLDLNLPEDGIRVLSAQ